MNTLHEISALGSEFYFDVQAVERIENASCWRKYQRRRQRLTRQTARKKRRQSDAITPTLEDHLCPAPEDVVSEIPALVSEVNEVFLFHASDHVDQVITGGFSSHHDQLHGDQQDTELCFSEAPFQVMVLLCVVSLPSFACFLARRSTVWLAKMKKKSKRFYYLACCLARSQG